ncbi:MAG: DUF2304 domain-containing protein [Saprospiraceae bacterium]|nr:DUF2304 domain-containing protein [Saprospiraceae bacterium]
MEIRYFQIIIPLISLLFIYFQYRDYSTNKSRINETVLVSLFWVGVSGLALFPDYISDIIANVFGIKDNINALIFFALGVLFYFQLQLYKTIRKQDKLLTELTRKVALQNEKNT